MFASSPAVSGIKTKFSAILGRMSMRERALMGAAVFVGLVILSYNAIEKTAAEFAELGLQIKQAQSDVELLPANLSKYTELKAKHDAIKSLYEGIEIQEGALSYLEKLIRDKAGLPSGQFNISDPPPRPFGKEYDQLPFLIKFSTVDFKGFIEFLKELVEGQKPFIISRLDLNRRRGSDRLEIELEVSSIRRKK